MRIGLFSDQYYPQISGVVVSIKNLYETLEAMGHTCYIFTCNVEKGAEDNPEITSKRVINFPGIRYPFKAAKDYKYTLSDSNFVDEISKYKLDIIHINSEFNISKIARKASKRLHIPVVYTVHTAWTQYICTLFPHTDKWLHNFWVGVMRHLFTKPTYKASTITILPTEKMIPDLKDYGIEKKNIVILPTGLDLSRFAKENIDFNEISELKKKYGLENKFVYEFIGRVAKEKNINEVIDAYDSKFHKNDDVRLLIVGDGPELNNLKKQVEKLGIKDKVVFAGMIDWKEIPKYYYLADIFVNASKSETQGLTYIEALASGLPVVAQNDLCIKGVIEDRYNGFIFDGKEGLIDMLDYSYAIRDALPEIKNNCYKSSVNFTKEEFAKKAVKIYERAIDIYQREHQNKKKNKK